MKIVNLRVKRYKSIENLEMSGLSDITVLIGENGSGKSNLLELLVLFFKEFTRVGRTTSQLTAEHWYKREQSNPIIIKIDLHLSRTELNEVFGDNVGYFVWKFLEEKKVLFSISTELTGSGQWGSTIIEIGDIILHDEGAQISIDEFLKEINFRVSTNRVYFVTPKDDSDKAITHVKKGIPYLLEEERNAAHRLELALLPFTDEEQHIQLEKTYQQWVDAEQIQSGEVLSMASYNIQNINQYLDNLTTLLRSQFLTIDTISKQPISPVRTQVIPVDEIRQILSYHDSPDGAKQQIWFKFKGKFESVFGGRLIPANNEIHYELNLRRYPLNSMGGGHSNWFRLLWQLSQVDKVLLLEEPETHMHSGLAKSVGSFLREAAIENQVIYSTHSTVFLDQSKYHEIWLVKYTDENGTIANRITNFEELRDIARLLGIDPSDVLLCNNLLLLEGQSDKNFIQAAAELMGVNLFPTRVSILPFEGSGKGRLYIRVFREVAIAANRPFFVLLDGDKDARKEYKKLLDDQLVEETQIIGLSRNDIEDYYPQDLLLEALIDEYDLNPEESELISEAISKTPRKKKIDQVLFERRELRNGIWKIPVSEYVSSKINLEELDDEIRNSILKIDRYFERMKKF